MVPDPIVEDVAFEDGVKAIKREMLELVPACTVTRSKTQQLAIQEKHSLDENSVPTFKSGSSCEFWCRESCNSFMWRGWLRKLTLV